MPPSLPTGTRRQPAATLRSRPLLPPTVPGRPGLASLLAASSLAGPAAPSAGLRVAVLPPRALQLQLSLPLREAHSGHQGELAGCHRSGRGWSQGQLVSGAEYLDAQLPSCCVVPAAVFGVLPTGTARLADFSVGHRVSGPGNCLICMPQSSNLPAACPSGILACTPGSLTGRALIDTKPVCSLP